MAQLLPRQLVDFLRLVVLIGKSHFCLLCFALLICSLLLDTLLEDFLRKRGFGWFNTSDWQLEVVLGLLAPMLFAPACALGEIDRLYCQELQRLHIDFWELVGLAVFLAEFEFLLVEFLVPGAARRWLGLLLSVRKEGEPRVEVRERVLVVLPA